METFTHYKKDGKLTKTPISFSEIIPVYDFIDTGRDLIGNYYVIDYHGTANKALKITKKWLDNDDRLFQLNFILHHKAVIGIQ